MIYEWFVQNKETLVAQNVLNSARLMAALATKQRQFHNMQKIAIHLAKQCHRGETGQGVFNFQASENWPAGAFWVHDECSQRKIGKIDGFTSYKTEAIS